MRSVRQITCEEASRLMSAALDRELPLPTRAMLRLHQTVCTSCRRFESQMELLRRALRGLKPEDLPASTSAPPTDEPPAAAQDAAADATPPRSPEQT